MSFLQDELDELERQQLRRSLRRHDDHPGRCIVIDGKPVLNFSSNNYLGLAGHPTLTAAAATGAARGTGSTASRLVTGNLTAHEELEWALADFHGLPAARLFNSGYQANLGLISALAGRQDLVVSDRLNHASLIDGSRLSRATIRIAAHRDPESFATCLADASRFRRRFVVTDSVFSMDGDVAPLAELRELCDQRDAFLIVDEAHAAGVLGPKGKGMCAASGIVADALVGGLGKGFGGFGGYVAGSPDLCEVLLNRARSFVYSTALPPAILAGDLAAVELLAAGEGERLRSQLRARIEQCSAGLAKLERLTDGAGHSAIFPLIAGDAGRALEWTSTLLGEGIFCQAIRPPTVEAGTARLRIALSALHTREDIEHLLGAVEGLA